MNLFENLQKLNEAEFYDKDEKTGLEYGINADGDLYLGDSESGYNLKDTPENRDKILRDFERYTEGINLNENNYSLVFNEFVEYLKSKNAQYIVDNLNETEFGLEFDIYNGDWKHEHAYIKQLVREFFDNKGIHGAISSEVIDDSESDTYSAHYDVILTKQNLNEDVNNDKLTIDDLSKYPYKFYETWKSPYNPTYSDDFLNLAEKYNCIKISNPLGPRGGDIGLYYGNWFICKNKEDYESLKTALEESDLNIFIKLSPLTSVDWKLVTDKLDHLTINRYINPYTIKWNSKSKKNIDDGSIDLSEYKELSTPIGDWYLYRKLGSTNKRVKWAARNQRTGEIKEITYSQALGDEPIDSSINGKQLGKTLDLKREASYGGAFDIRDDQYFTRDDLNEFAYEVINKVADLTNGDIYLDLISIYLEEDKSLEMTVEIDDEEYSYCKVIDMRKIKIPSDLNRKYADEYANGLINEINSNSSEYLDYQGHDIRTGEDKDANYDFWN